MQRLDLDRFARSHGLCSGSTYPVPGGACKISKFSALNVYQSSNSMNDKPDLATATIHFQSFSYPKAFQARNLCGLFSKASSGALPHLSLIYSLFLPVLIQADCYGRCSWTLPGASSFFPFSNFRRIYGFYQWYCRLAWQWARSTCCARIIPEENDMLAVHLLYFHNPWGGVLRKVEIN